MAISVINIQEKTASLLCLSAILSISPSVLAHEPNKIDLESRVTTLEKEVAELKGYMTAMKSIISAVTSFSNKPHIISTPQQKDNILEHIFKVMHNQQDYALKIIIGKINGENDAELMKNLYSEQFNETFSLFEPWVKDRFQKNIAEIAVTDSRFGTAMVESLNGILTEYGLKPRIISIKVERK